MTKSAPLLFCLAWLVGLSGCTHSNVPLRDREEARLAQMLKGRVAGEPKGCISAPNSSHLQILHRTAVVYRDGDTIWVARPRDPDSINAYDIVVIERTGGILCKQDVVRTIDRDTHQHSGIVFLGDFVPYRKP